MDLPQRPEPALSLADRCRGWAQWVGAGRLAAGAVTALVVVGSGYWLLRPPPATTESKLPHAGSATTAMVSSTAIITSAVAATFVVVHVAGAVEAPGVYPVPVGARVIDAVRAAGGLTVEANADAVNLAARIVDGERIYIPTVGEVVVPPTTAGANVETWPLNINVADAQQLEALPGVGPATAAAIIAHRQQHGPFASVDQLGDVRGIGPAKLAAIRSLVTV